MCEPLITADVNGAIEIAHLGTISSPTKTFSTLSSGSMKWWQEAVIYQIYPRSYQDSNGDGVGDLQGIIDRLDYLNDGTPNSLGVDAIWLSPIYPSPMFDFGYDISDYSDIDPLFGSLQDFQSLLDEAHQRNMKIIMDLVINHTSDLHPWFQQSRSSKDNPKRGWYIWKDPKYDIRGQRQPPNNWLGMFGGKGWKWDEHTQQYYFHSFLAEQPDLNWRNPEVKEAVFEMIRGWLDMGVDGFRLDVINYIFKDDQWRNNPVQHFKPARPYDRQRHVYDRDRQPELSGMLSDLRQLLESYEGDRTSVGEIQVEDHTKVKHVASCVGGKDQLHMAFNFAYFFTAWDARVFRKRIHEWDTACQQQEPKGGWPTYTLSNHDYERHISRYAPTSWASSSNQEAVTQARAKLAALMLLTLRGTPFLYYGEEIGMREEPVDRRHLKDPVGLRFWPFHPGRDGCRRPMAWTGEYSNGGGFTSAPGRHGHEVDDDCPAEAAVTFQGDDAPMEQALPKEAKPWLPLSHNLKFINVASQTDDPSSLLHFYKKCIWFRRGDEILRCGSQHIMMGQDDSDTSDGSRRRSKANQTPKGIIAFVREYKSGKRLVLLNFSGRKVTVPLFRQGYFADAAGFQVVLSTHDDRPVAAKEGMLNKDGLASSEDDLSILQGSSVTLSANEGMVIRVWSKRRFHE
jgi:alpha-glucosidase